MSAVRVAWGLLALAAAAAADDEAWNQTVVRERFGEIVSIYGDLRREGPYTRPAMPMPDAWGSLRLAGERRAVAWPARSPLHGDGDDPTAPLVERREELALSWRQQLGTPWLTTEVGIAGARDTRTDELHWGDLATDVVVPLWRARYQAVALALGARTPLGDRADWLLSAGDFSRSSWVGAGELRGSFAASLVTVQLRGGADYAYRGVNTVERGGEEVEVDHRRLRWDAAAGLGVRVLTWLRLGVEQRWTRSEWRPRSGGAEFARFHLTDAPLVGFVELTPVAGWHVAGWLGTQLAARDELAADERVVAGGSLAWVF